MFKFKLNQQVKINVSEEVGTVKGRAEYTACSNQYYILYKANDGSATTSWFDEEDLVSYLIE